MGKLDNLWRWYRHARLNDRLHVMCCLSVLVCLWPALSTLSLPLQITTKTWRPNTNMIFQYSPLPSSSYIRILILQPGEVGNPIRCSLLTAALQHAEYDALLYTLGDANIMQAIEVDGCSIEVTVNLEKALRYRMPGAKLLLIVRHLSADLGACRHIRSSSMPLLLCVDAICIDKSNNSEKSHQVALMGEIYRRCSQVRIWLGCDTPTCTLGLPVETKLTRPDLFTVIRELADDRHIFGLSLFARCEIETDGNIKASGDLEFSRQWAAFVAVAEIAWWSRVWNLQEAVLPRAGVFIYNTYEMSLEICTKPSAQCYRHALTFCANTTNSLSRRLSPAFTIYATNCQDLAQTQDRLLN